MTTAREPMLDDAQLAHVEQEVDRMLDRGSSDALRVLGYGEITLVLGWPADHPRVACKRLPLFADARRADDYGRHVDDYVATLRERGIDVVPTEWRSVEKPNGKVAGYVLQPVLDPATFATTRVANDPPGGGGVVEQIVDTIAATVDSHTGLDGQLANWAVGPDGRLRYYDVTTPFLADGDGRSRLDLVLLTSALPAAVRPVVRRFVAPGIVARFHEPRDVLLDFVGNLLKERFPDAVDVAIERANALVTPAITRPEVERFYRSDARTWEMLLRLRRADRWWQRNVRRRTYPFLLPGPIRR